MYVQRVGRFMSALAYDLYKRAHVHYHVTGSTGSLTNSILRFYLQLLRRGRDALERRMKNALGALVGSNWAEATAFRREAFSA